MPLTLRHYHREEPEPILPDTFQIQYSKKPCPACETHTTLQSAAPIIGFNILETQFLGTEMRLRVGN